MPGLKWSVGTHIEIEQYPNGPAREIINCGGDYIGAHPAPGARSRRAGPRSGQFTSGGGAPRCAHYIGGGVGAKTPPPAPSSCGEGKGDPTPFTIPDKSKRVLSIVQTPPLRAARRRRGPASFDRLPVPVVRGRCQRAGQWRWDRRQIRRFRCAI